MIEKLFYMTVARDGIVVYTELKRGRFLNYQHYTGLLAHWSGITNPGLSYFYYPARDQNHELPTLKDHTSEMPHLGGLSHGYRDAFGREIYS